MTNRIKNAEATTVIKTVKTIGFEFENELQLAEQKKTLFVMQNLFKIIAWGWGDGSIHKALASRW